MQNPHLIVGSGHRCLCGSYNLMGTQTPVSCDDIIKASEKLAEDGHGHAEGVMLYVVLRELIEDRG